MRSIARCIYLSVLLIAVSGATALAQGDDATGRVLNADTKKQIGTAEIVTTSANQFGMYFRILLDGGKLRILRPSSGSRSSTINCSLREYQVDVKAPKDESRWVETGAGNASVQVPTGDQVKQITGSMTLTERSSGDKTTPVSERPTRFIIVLD